MEDYLHLRRASMATLLQDCSAGLFLHMALFMRLPTPSQGFYGRIFAGLQRRTIPAQGGATVMFCGLLSQAGSARFMQYPAIPGS